MRTANRCAGGTLSPLSGGTANVCTPAHQFASPIRLCTSRWLGMIAWRSGGSPWNVPPTMPAHDATTADRPTAAMARRALAKLQHRHERFLRNLNRTHPLHAPFAFLLLPQELPLPRHVA